MENYHIEEHRFCDGPLAEPDEVDELPDEPSNEVPLNNEEIAAEDAPF
jgi:hypothetical protein